MRIDVALGRRPDDAGENLLTVGAGIALAVPFALLAGAMVWTLPETKGVRLMAEFAKT